MRIGIVSDIHGNLEALDHALSLMGDVDEVLCTGDASDQARFSDPVMARLREIGAHFVQGNHEEALLRGFRPFPLQGDADLLEWTRAQPKVLSTVIHGKRLLAFHATPWWPHADYLFADTPDFARLADEDADIIIYGHTHYQHVGSVGGALVVNPGSAGQPRDPRNMRQDSFAILDVATGDAEVFDFPDPVRARGELL